MEVEKEIEGLGGGARSGVQVIAYNGCVAGEY